MSRELRKIKFVIRLNNTDHLAILFIIITREKVRKERKSLTMEKKYARFKNGNTLKIDPGDRFDCSRKKGQEKKQDVVRPTFRNCFWASRFSRLSM